MVFSVFMDKVSVFNQCERLRKKNVTPKVLQSKGYQKCHRSIEK